MAKPIIKKITPFSVTDGTTILFSYTGLVPVKNTIIIQDGISMEEIYTCQQTAPVNNNLSYVLGANIPGMINGGYYCARIKCHDENNGESAWSDPSFFYCFSKPTFSLKDLSSSSITTVDSSEIKVKLNYSQTEGETLMNYNFKLYNYGKVVIASSGDIYTGEQEYTFRGLENDTNYYLRCIGLTTKGIVLDTGMYQISANYEAPSTFMLIDTTIDDAGVVKYSSNIVLVNPEKDADEYTFDNGKIILNNDSLIYSQGFELNSSKNKEYTIVLNMNNGTLNGNKYIRFLHYDLDDFSNKIIKNETYLTCSDCGNGTRQRYKLTTTDSFFNTIVYSNEVEIDSQPVTIWIQYNNGLFDLLAFREEQ